jgi:hypothetical protein
VMRPLEVGPVTELFSPTPFHLKVEKNPFSESFRAPEPVTMNSVMVIRV